MLTNNHAPFMTNYTKSNELCDVLKAYCGSMSSLYKNRGFGAFIMNALSIKHNEFINIHQREYLMYWVLQEMKIRCLAWKLILKLQNNVLKNKSAQNQYLLDLDTPSQEYKYPVYIFSNLKYWIFSIDEIRKCFLMHLSQSDMYESSPRHPINPYTNEQLSTAQLLHIYLQIGHLKLHPYIHSYARRYFDISLFHFFNKSELESDASKDYIKSLDGEGLQLLCEYYVNSPVSKIISSSHIPLDVKKGILKRIINEEPLHTLESPLFLHYNISMNPNLKPRKMRKARRPQRRST